MFEKAGGWMDDMTYLVADQNEAVVALSCHRTRRKRRTGIRVQSRNGMVNLFTARRSRR
jgi:hypothetical protein